MQKLVLLIILIVSILGCSLDAGENDNSQETTKDVLPDTCHEDESEIVMQQNDYPSPDSWEHANTRQRQRAARSFKQLAKHQVPVFPGPLFVNDDEEVKLQTPQEVARRTLVLWAVALRGEGIPKDEAVGLIEQQNLWGSVSPEEKQFLEDDDPDPQMCQSLVWRLESIWVLLWALGYIEDLQWPSGMCDVPKLAEILNPHESNPEFITQAKLRKKAEILDAQDLILRIHWAIRDAYLNQGGMIPDNLDWSKDYELIHVSMSPAVGVVEQRHHTLNWLVRFLNPESWDDVDTPT